MESMKKASSFSPEKKKTLGIVFLILFLDLVGFSIIFPLFPSLAKYYLEHDADNFFLKSIFSLVEFIAPEKGGFSQIVLFGGILGALYSFLQFLFAPFWGKLSDQIGRKKVLQISTLGIFVSYILWFFSGNFTLLILARLVGGIMGANISTASAVVADITDSSQRSRGMAIIGIAFALGFIIGPALGGIFSHWNLEHLYPSLAPFGVNPFSLTALIAAILSLFALIMIQFRFSETLPESKRGKKGTTRSSNPFYLFKSHESKGVNQTNWGNFLFISFFSGMEFTLTFLAVEKLGYSSMDNAWMFIFIGVVLALVQGGYVRRKAHLKGEKNFVLQGLVFVVIGLVIFSFVQSSFVLYLGLFFMAIGSAMVIPCLTALNSLYAKSFDQGQTLGIFRSLGALGRVIGPLAASFIYWSLGNQWPYWIGSLGILLTLFYLARLPKPSK